MDIQVNIKTKIKEVLASLNIEAKEEEIVLNPSDNREHGDYASNIAFRKAKMAHMAPLDLANKIAETFSLEGVEKVEAVKPGFLNFFLKADSLGAIIKTIVADPIHFGDLTIGKGKKVNIEYICSE